MAYTNFGYFLGESKGIFQIKKNLVNKKKLLELFGVLLDPVNEFSNIGPTAAANELELNDELSSIVELVGDGDSSNDTIGFTSATITKTFVVKKSSIHHHHNGLKLTIKFIIRIIH